ncbi:MAG: ornithine carbamoyltransferase [Kordiimonas sp.]|nr:ornithine carbamoyltransferase [Kordiimonas sp.]|tara:strand:+ start:93 stop:1040 length:948 start_codon:yes stop_codon:yes gene_type:complete
MTTHNAVPKYNHFLDLSDLTTEQAQSIIANAKRLKAEIQGRPHGTVHPERPLQDITLAMIFEKPSTRTRVSFEMAIHQLGGNSLVLQGGDTQLGRGETVADTSRVLSRFVDAIMLRAREHDALLEMARTGSVPVINALTNWSHPCQIMADVLTYEEHRGSIKDKIVAWSGDGNNVAVSWIHAAVLFECELRLACPPEYLPPQEALDWAEARGGRITVTQDPSAAAKDCDLMITDTWVSMGDTNAEERLSTLAPYQVNEALMALAKDDALFMHCLPAHREEEVTTGVIDGPQSVIWDEAENRLHAQKAILMWCLGK